MSDDLSQMYKDAEIAEFIADLQRQLIEKAELIQYLLGPKTHTTMMQREERNVAILQMAEDTTVTLNQISDQFHLSCESVRRLLATFGTRIHYHAAKSKEQQARAERNAAIMQMAEDTTVTLEQIGDQFHLTKTRIQQILKKFGIRRRADGAAIVTAKMAAKAAVKKAARAYIVKTQPEFDAYRNMMSRCYRPNNPAYRPGITVCPRWLEGGVGRRTVGFKNFYTDLGPRPEGVHPKGNAMYWLRLEQGAFVYSPETTKWGIIEGWQGKPKPKLTMVA